MKKLPVALITGLAAIAVTTILFFTILSDTKLDTIHYMSLGGIILAELVTMGYTMCSKGDPRRVAAGTVSAVMIPFALILSIIYMSEYPKEYGTFCGWYFAAAIIVNAIALVLFFMNTKKDIRLDNAKANMLNMRKLVKCIMMEPAAQPYNARLRALEEKLHFANDSVMVPEDATIRQLLVQLQTEIGNPGADVDALLTKLEKTVQTRTIMTSRTV